MQKQYHRLLYLMPLPLLAANWEAVLPAGLAAVLMREAVHLSADKYPDGCLIGRFWRYPVYRCQFIIAESRLRNCLGAVKYL